MRYNVKALLTITTLAAVFLGAYAIADDYLTETFQRWPKQNRFTAAWVFVGLAMWIQHALQYSPTKPKYIWTSEQVD